MNTVECPECGKVLKTANPIAPGKKVRCPGCKGIFTMPSAKPPASSGIRARAGAVAPKRPPVDDDDDLPTPKRRRRDEDDEDIDDRDEDDEDDRPRKKKKKKAAGPNWVLVGGGAGVAVLVLLLVAGFVWPGFFLGGSAGPGGGPAAGGPGGTGQENLLAYLPRGAQVFFGVDATKSAEVAKQLQDGMVSKFQQQMQQIPGAALPPGMDAAAVDQLLRDTQRVVVGAEGKDQGSACVAISTSKPLEFKQVAKALNADKTPAKDHQGKPYANLPDGPPGGPPLMVGMPNNRVILLGVMPEEEFKSLLSSNGQQPLVSADAQALIGTVDKSYLWGAVVISGDIAQGMQMLTLQLAMLPDLAPAAGALQKLKGVSVAMDESPTKDQKLSIALSCASDSDAALVSKSLNNLWIKTGRKMLAGFGFMAAQPGMEGVGDLVNDISRSLKIDSNGAMARASVSVTEKTMKKLEQMQGQMLQNFGGAPPGFGAPPKGLPKKK